MITNQHDTVSGYLYTFQKISDTVSHLIIKDSNLYPDSDSRSTQSREWIFPINNQTDINKIKKLFI